MALQMELQYLACATVSRNRGCNAATRSFNAATRSFNAATRSVIAPRCYKF